MKIIRMLLEVNHLDLSSVLAHKHEHVTAIGITMELMLDNLHQSMISASHISNSRHEVEVTESVNR